jgi:NAD(P)-dependent dehydrogenase (short-subunit alcohol dehydrogenase family)
VRSSSKAEEAKKGIVKYVKDHAADQASTVERRLSAHLVEMSDFASVRSLCEELQFPIDILINNAGLQSKEKQLTNDGYELTWQVNYLCSTFLMTKLLLPRLEEAGKLNQRRSRVINISSGMHKMVEDFDFDDFNFDKRPYGFVQGMSCCTNNAKAKRLSNLSAFRTAYTQSKLAQILNVEYYTNVVLPPTISSTATLFYCVEPGSVKTSKISS